MQPPTEEVCEYDGDVLSQKDGQAESCPSCEADIEEHRARCRACRTTTNLPDSVTLLQGGHK